MQHTFEEKTISTMNTQDLLIKLRELKPQMRTRYKAKEIGLFGSFVRGQQCESSDIDVLVEFEEGADLFDMVGLALLLEEQLQRNVDVVPKDALRPELRESVLQEVVPL
jgi:predicted nucleotidyltransferase